MNIINPPTRFLKAAESATAKRRNGRGKWPRLAAPALAAGLVLSACGASSPTATSTAATVAPAAASAVAATASGAATSSQVILPVASNPIVSTATAQTLTVDSVLVENNVDSTGKAAADHLEIALSNSGTADLVGVEVFYTFDDPATAISESYYAKLPNSFSIPAGGTRVAHFDDSGAPDHFPVNKFSLYYTDTNTMDVTIMVSAADAAPQTLTVMKDAGGPETAD